MQFSTTLSAVFALAASVSAWPYSTKHSDAYYSDHVFTFTSTYKVWATPDQVVNANNTFTGGLAGAKGLYKYGINSDENTICYNITLRGFRGEYQSPAITATHIHEGARGKNGPPRIAFPNPVDIGNGFRRSVGCIRGPFRTGINGTNGRDTGAGFTVKQIEDNPSGFFTDVHSSLAVPGAVRAQLDCGHENYGFY